MLTRIVVVAMGLLGTSELQAQEPSRDLELEYPKCVCQADELVVSRSDCHELERGQSLNNRRAGHGTACCCSSSSEANSNEEM